eukprot:m.22384 g.22384  ORF g.22384 m.22384 type:complete len:380 (-) comp13802_c0_seq1:201-1340(-)
MEFTTATMLLLVTAAALCAHAQIDERFAKNITVYHVNQDNYSATPFNMNTADLHGDMYFDMRSRGLALECGIWYNHSFWSKLDCSDAEVDANPRSLAVSKIVLEVDARYAGYQDCNVAAGDYTCDCEIHVQANCSERHTADTCCEYGPTCKSYAYGCEWDMNDNRCEIFGCPNITDASECTQTHHFNCTWDNKADTCLTVPQPKVVPCNSSRVGMETLNNCSWCNYQSSESDMTEIDYWHANVMKKMNDPNPAVWYSTTGEGWCDPEKPGPCSWRLVETEKKIRKDCSDNGIEAAVRSYGHTCFDECSPADQKNLTSVCYILCWYNTVLGPEGSSSHNITGGMPVSLLEAAWEKPFESSDPNKGGCPDIRDEQQRQQQQ